MNYLVIDLEMCKVPRDYRSKRYKYANETIQIGAVLLDEEFKRIGTLSQFVHPEHGVIDYFIDCMLLTLSKYSCVIKWLWDIR